MTYAEGRTFYDADSHIMELPDFLRDGKAPDDFPGRPAAWLPYVVPAPEIAHERLGDAGPGGKPGAAANCRQAAVDGSDVGPPVQFRFLCQSHEA